MYIYILYTCPPLSFSEGCEGPVTAGMRERGIYIVVYMYDYVYTEGYSYGVQVRIGERVKVDARNKF